MKKKFYVLCYKFKFYPRNNIQVTGHIYRTWSEREKKFWELHGSVVVRVDRANWLRWYNGQPRPFFHRQKWFLCPTPQSYLTEPGVVIFTKTKTSLLVAQLGSNSAQSEVFRADVKLTVLGKKELKSVNMSSLLL